MCVLGSSRRCLGIVWELSGIGIGFLNSWIGDWFGMSGTGIGFLGPWIRLGIVWGVSGRCMGIVW